MPVTRDSPSIQGDVLAQTPPGLPLTRRSPGGARLSGQPAGSALPGRVRDAARRCPHERVRRSDAGRRRRRQGCGRFGVPRETRQAAGRAPMARTGFPATPGSRHRGSVDGRPRSGGRAASPPGPSDSPSLGTHEGARRPALSGGTSAGLAVAPYAPFSASVPQVGDNLRPWRGNAIQCSTHSCPAAG
jgi:hypothetical protein